MYLPKRGKWLLQQHLYLKISGFHARKNPKQQNLKQSRSVMLHSAKRAFIFTTTQLRQYTEQTIHCMRKF